MHGRTLDKRSGIGYLPSIMTILAVEDDPDYLEMLQGVLQGLGHSLFVSRGAKEALSLLKEKPVDVIISDVKMPEMDGVEFHKRVRAMAEYRNTPFIFLTGVRDLSEVRADLKPDLDLLLQKPFPVDKLLELFSGKLRT